MKRTVGLVGGRGYTGAELLALVNRHPQLKLAFASSTSEAGRSISDVCPGWPHDGAVLVGMSPETCGDHEADAWVLAVPNGQAAAWAAAIRRNHPDAVILDLSADHRFDRDWAYGLPERFRAEIRQSRQIANPGCYATGSQLGLLPVKDYLVGTPVIFGVSGYSGAGRKPSDKNDPERLRENLLPYQLSGHVHEKEISHQLAMNVRFMPHVTSFFRGISLTISAQVDHEASPDKLYRVYGDAYRNEPRIKVLREIPEVQAVRDTPDAHVGGFAVDERDPSRFSVVVALDNLAKGAASQAIQNLNLALGLVENTGIENE
ncbi:MAG: N-acetyl-gamma-glutamyl-phosphate reductase [Xanthomonadales bacterium]|nr:N-acetyl-gamma-glutamyl-phosphate reductase [Xanthomonadales bacterium]